MRSVESYVGIVLAATESFSVGSGTHSTYMLFSTVFTCVKVSNDDTYTNFPTVCMCAHSCTSGTKVETPTVCAHWHLDLFRAVIGHHLSAKYIACPFVSVQKGS